MFAGMSRMRRICFAVALAALAYASWAGIPASAQVTTSYTENQNCFLNFSNGEYSSAVTACTRAINLNSDDEWAYIERCTAYDVLGNYAAALSDCTHAIVLNPRDENAFAMRCDVQGNMGNYGAALADCNQAITLNGNDADAYVS